VILAKICEMLAVRRKCDGTVHIANQNAWRAAEHGCLVQNGNRVFGFVAANEVEIVSIRRKRETEITRCGWSDDLRVTTGLYVAKAERLEAILFPYDGEIFSVWGNRGDPGVSVIGKVFDGKMFEGRGRGLPQERKDSVSRGEQ